MPREPEITTAREKTMKLIHLSDLHLGKRVNDYSMTEDQRYILKSILRIIETERPDGVIIAGDVYDKSVPSADAVRLFDAFLSQLARRGLQVFVISGNHDSAERIAFGARIMDAKGIYLSPVYEGSVEPVCLEDDYGPIRFYLLPFLKPGNVRPYHEDREILTHADAVRCAIDDMGIDPEIRNVLIAHQFVTGASRTESEEISVGGTENVDAEVFEAFDYVALGHLHAAQNCGSPRIRYCGSPLKYSFSEVKDQKSVTVVELREKGSLSIKTVPLTPRFDLVELRGTYDAVTRKDFYAQTSWQEDYTHIILTDEEDIPDALGKLRTVYHHLMKLDYDNRRTQSDAQITADSEVETKTPFELFAAFYELQNNQPMSGEQSAFLSKLIEKTWEGEK